MLLPTLGNSLNATFRLFVFSGCSLIPSPVRVPREPKEVHPRHQDGLRWSQEGQGQERPDHLPPRRDQVDEFLSLPSSSLYLYNILRTRELEPRLKERCTKAWRFVGF